MTRASWLLALSCAGLGVLAAGCDSDKTPSPEQVTRGSSELRATLQHGQPVRDPNRAAAAAVVPASPNLSYFGGRVVSNAQVVEVIYGTGSYIPQVTSTASPSIATFYQGVLNSPYVDWLTEYNTTGLPTPTTNQVIGRGSFLTQVTIAPSAANNGATIDDTNIQAELALQIQAGTLPPPSHDAQGNNNTYYAIFFPHGKTISLQGSLSCQVFCAYHGTVANVPGFGEIYYGVHPDFQSGSGCEFGCGAAPTVFGNYTQVASHELIETITDAEVGLATTFGPPLAWYDQISNAEIGDLCNDQHATIVGSDGVTYDVQTEFSNAAGACVVSRSPSLAVAPTTFEGGAAVTGTVKLVTVATTATTVSLVSSTSSLVTVPATVVIPAGSTSATFALTSVPTGTQTAVTVTATFPTTPPTTSAVSLTVLASPTVSALALAPTSVTGGATSTATVTLSGPAPSGGATVTLSSNNTGAATVPATLVIPQGATSGTFTVSTLVQTFTTSATISASYHNTTQSAVLGVTRVPSLISLTVAPAVVQGGGTVTGTGTISDPAPAGGAVVQLASTNPTVAMIPSTVTVPAGQVSVVFSIVTTATSAPTSVTISGTFPASVTLNALLTVVPSPTPQSLTLGPASVPGGMTSTGTVTLTGPAPAGGSAVALSSSSSIASVPAVLTIPQGQSTGTFTVTTTATTVSVAATISATLNSLSRSAVLTVTKVLPVGNAVFDPALKAPRCNTVGAFCDTGGLIDGRDNIAGGPEQNAPNTIGNSCADGTAGTYHIDESIDQLRISTVDGSNLAPGKAVRIDTTVWVFDSNDHLDLYLTTDATAAAPVWTLLNATTITPTTGGAVAVLSFTTTLPATGATSWAVRANFRFTGSQNVCAVGSFDDHDDLVFLVDTGSPPVNQPPIVNAGPDQTVTLPAVATLAGAVTDDGLPNPPGAVTVAWTKISGPGTVTFGNPAAAATTATFSTAGAYVLRLTANDGALSASDDIAVTVNPVVPVNQPPVVNAGPDLTITLPAGASLAGTVSDDGLPNPPGVVTISWSKVSGPGTVTFANGSVASTTATFSAAGSYVLRLSASDSALSATDDVAVTVNPAPVNQPPLVNAGPDRTVTLPAAATLSGSVSDDGLPNPPGVVTIPWSKVSGPGTVTFANGSVASTTATFSAAGSYVLRLTANDSALSATDDVAVTVNAATNQRPVVNAGPDQTITLPAAASLAGTATDDGLPNPPGTLTTTWSKVSGPGTVTFANASAKATTATFSTAGAYVLRLTASDSALSATDDIAVTVNAASGNSPCASLCTNPTNITVNGSFQSGNLGTGAVCFQTTSPVHGGNCGNFVSPRTLKVNGTTETCNGQNWSSVPPARNGGYCVQTTTGNQSFAFFTLF